MAHQPPNTDDDAALLDRLDSAALGERLDRLESETAALRILYKAALAKERREQRRAAREAVRGAS